MTAPRTGSGGGADLTAVQISPGVAAACPWCAAPARSGDRFCEVCGADLRTRRAATTAAGTDSDSDSGADSRGAAVRSSAAAPCPRCGHAADDDDDGYCTLCGLRRPDATDHVDVVVAGGAAVSDRGHVRPRNEDAVALGRGAPDDARSALHPIPALPATTLAAVVCDGVSSVPDSELAARSAADATLAHLLAPAGDGDRGDGDRGDGERRVRAAVAAGAAAAAAAAPPGTRPPPSSTLVCALVDLADPTAPVITVGWVGDSRAYWLATRDGGPRLLTADHVAATAPPGTVDPLVVAARPDAITRWLGADGEAEPDVRTLAPTGPGVLLLCTDGLWKYVPDAADLSAVVLPALYDGGPPTAAAALTAAALGAGGEDNVTVAVIPVFPVPVPRSSS